METPLQLSRLWLGHGGCTGSLIMRSGSVPVGRPTGVVPVKHLFYALFAMQF